MDIGNRIKQRRIDLDISAEDLSDMIGKSRATIYRYENGDIKNMPTTVLEPLAEALRTTPEYLMGWTDDPHDWERIGNEEGIYPPNDYDGDYIDWVKAKYYQESDALVDSYYDTYDSAKRYIESLNCTVQEIEGEESIIIKTPNGMTYRADINDVVNNYLIFGSSKPGIKKLVSPYKITNLRDDEKKLLKSYNILNSNGQDEARKRVRELTLIPDYAKEQSSDENTLRAAHARTDKKLTSEDQNHDWNIMINDDEWK